MVEQYYCDYPNDFRRIEIGYATVKKYEGINLLWLVPLRDSEYEWIKEHSSEEALERCKKAHRELIVFDGEGVL
ncbi:suppressor of fused domain protein [Lachnospiraceae bacterium MD335]|nr:suppressor of fused domain protein [Lachnospiraceae bacterium MD335]